MKFVIKIGGSVLFDDVGSIKIDLIRNWIEIIEELQNQDHQVAIVVGGGKPARQFSKIARDLGAPNSYQDLIGIEAARQNARLLISGLPSAYPDPPSSYQEFIKVAAHQSLVVVGGFQPGQSTNAVAAILAEEIGADYLFNMSNISKVYDKDPEEYPDAKPFDKLTYSEFEQLLVANEQLPGTYALFDNVGLEIVKRSKIKLTFLDGSHPEYIPKLLSGKSLGTVVE